MRAPRAGRPLDRGCGGCCTQINYGTPVYYQNVVNSQLQTFQTYDTLAPGACIPQGTQLWSANGLFYLYPQNDGDLVLYYAGGGGVFYSNSYVNAGAGPFQLCMQTVRRPPLPTMSWRPNAAPDGASNFPSPALLPG